MKYGNPKTLVIAPHLDDESISCGGLIQKRIEAAGDWRAVDIAVVYGRVYAYGEVDGTDEEVLDFRQAIKELGSVYFQLLMAKEGEPAQVGYYHTLRFVERMLMHEQYDEVIIPAGDDLNQDHRFLNHVCKIALRPFNLGSVRRVMEFFALDGTIKQPNRLEVLTPEQLLTKQRAVGMYRREAREGCSPRSPANIEAQARVWGSMVGAEFAEGYRVILEKN